MTIDHQIDRLFTRYPAVATLCYFATVFAFVFVTWSAAADLYEQHQAVAAASDILGQLEGRNPVLGGSGPSASPAREGSPFLEGRTVTVAGAALLQRVAGAVTRVGGNVLSSQVDVQGTQSKDGVVSLMASCEIADADLQKLLYDLEAGMPYLFVDQLVVQAPESTVGGAGARLRVMIGVSGQWQGSK